MQEHTANMKVSKYKSTCSLTPFLCSGGCIQKLDPSVKVQPETGCYKNSLQKVMVNPLIYIGLIQTDKCTFTVDLLDDQANQMEFILNSPAL